MFAIYDVLYTSPLSPNQQPDHVTLSNVSFPPIPFPSPLATTPDDEGKPGRILRSKSLNNRYMMSSIQKNSSSNVTELENLTSTIMDKKYDSEEIHKLMWEQLNSYSLIFFRTHRRKKIDGYYRRELARSIVQARYNRRNLVEMVFSVLKRKFGECRKSKK